MGCPGTREIIGHKVNEIEILRGLEEVNITQRPFPSRECRCEEIWRGKIIPELLKK